jgi:hypothetical protein
VRLSSLIVRRVAVMRRPPTKLAARRRNAMALND